MQKTLETALQRVDNQDPCGKGGKAPALVEHQDCRVMEPGSYQQAGASRHWTDSRDLRTMRMKYKHKARHSNPRCDPSPKGGSIVPAYRPKAQGPRWVKKG